MPRTWELLQPSTLPMFEVDTNIQSMINASVWIEDPTIDTSILSKEDFFWDIEKLKQAKGFTSDRAFNETINYYKAKWLRVKWFETAFEEPKAEEIIEVETPEIVAPEVLEIEPEEKWVFTKLEKVWETLKFEAGNPLQESKNPTAQAFWRMIEAFKFAWNIPWDTIELAWELWQVLSSPIETAKSLETMAWWMVEAWLNKIFDKDVYTSEERRAAVEWTKKALEENFWTIERAMDTITENPTDVLTSFMGWIQTIKPLVKDSTKLAKLNQVQEAINPINILKTEGKIASYLPKKAISMTWELGKTITAKASGLSPETLSTIFKQPDLVRQWLSKESTAKKVKKAIDVRIEEVWDLWKEYGKLRKGKVVAQWDELDDMITKKTKGVEPKELTKVDNKVFEEAKWYVSGYRWDVTDGNLMSLRKQIDSLKYDPTTWVARKLSPNGDRLITSIRKWIDDLAKDRIPWLKELDIKFAPEIRELKKVKELLYDRAGNLKDNYIQQVSNLLWKGKELKLERVRKLVPEIDDEIKALKALEDVELAKWNKVWAYVQGWGVTAAVFGVVDPTVAIATLLLTSPTVVSNLVKAAWYSTKITQWIINKIKTWVKLSQKEATIVWQAIKEHTLERWADLVDNAADKLWARAKFIDDSDVIDLLQKQDDALLAEQRVARWIDKLGDVQKSEKAAFREAVIEQRDINKWNFKKAGSAESATPDDIVKLFHWTKRDFDKFDINKANKLSNYWQGFYFTTSQDRANLFWKIIKEVDIKKGDILDLWKEATKEKANKILQSIWASFRYDYNPTYREIYNFITNDAVKAIDNIDEAFYTVWREKANKVFSKELWAKALKTDRDEYVIFNDELLSWNFKKAGSAESAALDLPIEDSWIRFKIGDRELWETKFAKKERFTEKPLDFTNRDNIDKVIEMLKADRAYLQKQIAKIKQTRNLTPEDAKRISWYTAQRQNITNKIEWFRKALENLAEDNLIRAKLPKTKIAYHWTTKEFDKFLESKFWKWAWVDFAWKWVYAVLPKLQLSK